jgi:hypothetical protein
LLNHRTSVVQELPETRPFLIRLALTPKLEPLALVAPPGGLEPPTVCLEAIAARTLCSKELLQAAYERS